MLGNYVKECIKKLIFKNCNAPDLRIERQLLCEIVYTCINKSIKYQDKKISENITTVNIY